MATFYEATKAKEQIAKELLKNKEILGVGVGYYNPKNPKQGASIIIYSKKATASILAAATPKSVTTKVNGKDKKVPIRIIKNDSFKPNLTSTSTKYTRRIRPVQAGYSVGTPDWSGTGGVVTINYPQKNKLFLLSNNHVLNKNNTAIYVPTLQPGGADGGTVSKDKIGSLYSFVKINKTRNYIDGAISKPIYNSILSRKYAEVGYLRGHYLNYRVGQRFIKVGRTTGLVGGWVESINTDVKVDYGSFGNLGEVLFKNQTVIRSNTPISVAGDSGSVWLNYYNRYAAAVNYAGSSNGKLSISYPISWAMQAFGLRIATRYGAGGVLATKTKENTTRMLTKKELNSLNIK